MYAIRVRSEATLSRNLMQTDDNKTKSSSSSSSSAKNSNTLHTDNYNLNGDDNNKD